MSRSEPLPTEVPSSWEVMASLGSYSCLVRLGKGRIQAVHGEGSVTSLVDGIHVSLLPKEAVVFAQAGSLLVPFLHAEGCLIHEVVTMSSSWPFPC